MARSTSASFHQLAHHVQDRRGALPAPAACSASGHVHVHVDQPAGLAAVAPGQARSSCSARARAPARAPTFTFADAPLVVIADRDVARRGRAPRPAARTPASNPKSLPTLVTTAESAVSAIAGQPAPLAAANRPDQLGREVLRVGRAAAVAEHQHLAARRRAPRASPPRPRTIDVGAARPPPAACSAAASPNAARTTIARHSRVAASLRRTSVACARAPARAAARTFAANSSARQLHRRPRRRVLPDLHRVVLAAADALPSRRASESAADPGGPRTSMPNRSNTSRSGQPAAGIHGRDARHARVVARDAHLHAQPARRRRRPPRLCIRRRRGTRGGRRPRNAARPAGSRRRSRRRAARTAAPDGRAARGRRRRGARGRRTIVGMSIDVAVSIDGAGHGVAEDVDDGSASISRPRVTRSSAACRSSAAAGRCRR